jgi:hypothetical protein
MILENEVSSDLVLSQNDIDKDVLLKINSWMNHLASYLLPIILHYAGLPITYKTHLA